jgi:hypothetical protein
MSAFDYFIALDGNGLNGFEGFGGVARLRCDPARSQGGFEVKVRYYDGLAGGHALQLNTDGTLAFLGNLSQQLFLFDPRTLEEVARWSTLRVAAPTLPYESQTHVAWLDARRFVTPIGPDFWLFEVGQLDRPIKLGAHGVTLPHALKRSPSGRYLFYGAMDHHRRGYANQAGIFELSTCTARVVALPATVWHLGVDAERDVFYAPTQRCAPQGSSFVEYTIDHAKNYLFEVDGAEARVTRHLAIPKDLPGALTSDVVVTPDHVVYNACASGVLVRVDRATLSRIEFFDERPSLWRAIGAWPVAAANVLETFSRADIPGNTHVLLKAIRATRGSAIDGSYGLQLSPDGTQLLSAHRGLNEVLIYDYPSMSLRRRVPFPPIREYFPEHFGRWSDPRLGFHHTALSTRTVG